MSIDYPLREESTVYGPLLTPMIELPMSTIYGWRNARFVIDTGADFTTVPESLAEMTGLDLSKCPRESVMGIEGRLLPARVGSLTLLIGKVPLAVRCHFLKSEMTPYLLGRMDLFSRFNILFNNRARRVSLTRF